MTVLDAEDFTLRLHDLFREFLRDRLRRDHPHQVAGLLVNAARSESDPMHRVDLLLQASAYDEAQSVLVTASDAMLASGDGNQVIRLIERFPSALRSESPLLAHLRGLCAWQESQYETMQAVMHHAVRGFERLADLPAAQQARAFEALSLILGGKLAQARECARVLRSLPMPHDTEVLSELLAFWETALTGPAPQAGVHLSRLVDLLLQGTRAAVWSWCIPSLSVFVGRAGVGAQVERLVSAARATAEDSHPHLQTAMHVLEAWVLLWKGRLNEVLTLLPELEDESRWLGHPRNQRGSQLRLIATCHAMRGDRAAAHKACQAMLDYNATSSNWLGSYYSGVGRLAIATGDWTTARHMLEKFEGLQGTQSWISSRHAGNALAARLAMHEGKLEDALRLLRDAVVISGDRDRAGMDTMVRLCLAQAELRGGSPRAAWQAIEPVVQSVHSSGEIGSVLLVGIETLDELTHAPWLGAAPPHGLAALEEWAHIARQIRSANHTTAEAARLDEAALSEREFDVLTCIAAGESNKIIARSLDLSPHTVKRHVARILRRLNVSSRGQAAIWYQRRGLEP